MITDPSAAGSPALPFLHTPAPAPRTAARAAHGAAVLLAALLAACGGNDGQEPAAAPPPPPPPAVGSVSVAASLGAVFNGDVSVTCAPSGAALGSGSTGSTGVVTVSTSGSCAGPVLVTVSGRSDGTSTYFDEALASVLPYPAGSSLRAVAPALSSTMSLGVTPLTEIATRQALAAAGSLAALSTAQVNTANTAVVTQVLGAGVTLDILAPPTLWSAATATGSLGTSAADRYALYLAGLARMGLGAASPALAVTAALAADLADGTLSGSTSGFVYSAATLASQLSAGLNGMAAYANPALQAALGIAPPAALVLSGFAPASGAAGATVTISGSGFDPDPFHVQVKFASNLAAEVVSSSATAVVVKVPAGAVTGPIEVSNTLRAQTTTTSASFTVTTAGGGGGGTGAWVSRASPSSFLLNGLAYGAGRFVAAGFGNALLTSTDGLSWTAATPPDKNYYEAKSVTWTGSQFVMVGDRNFGFAGPSLIATSPDGLAWTRRTWAPGIDGDTAVDVATGGGKLTVVGLNGSVASSSNEGLSWSNEAQGHAASFTGVAGNAGTRVAVGRDAGYNGVILVDSGSGWVKASGISEFVPQDVTWTGSQFVAVGGSFAGIGANAVLMTSPDGLAWTRLALPADAAPAGFALRAVAAIGSTLYASGDNGSTQHVIVRSDDGGKTWSQAYKGTTTGNAMLAGIASSGDRIVMVGGVKALTLP